jgi:hypothetical protein
MKLRTAVARLIEEVEFLGMDNIGELVEDIERNPLAYPYATINAYLAYKEQAFR